MTPSGLLDTRLRQQGLVDSPHSTPAQVVAWLGAVQAQDYAGAAWAVAQRAPGVTRAQVDRALDAGRILRTHVLRPTWHLVAPADIRWMLALTAPRVQRLLAAYDKRLELDGPLYARARTLFEKALQGGRSLTRTELAQTLRARGIEASGQRLAHLVMHAEFEGAICSGPRQGTHITYALVAERAPKARLLPRDEARAALAARYFRSHGPATIRDFAWWSGLTMADAKAGAADGAARDQVLTAPPSLQRVAGAHYLLSNYDEYLIAYRDRGAVLEPARSRNFGVFTSVEYPHQIVIDGQVAGSWKREVDQKAARLSLRWYRRPAPRHHAAVTAEAVRYGRFAGLPCAIAASDVM